MGQEQPLLLMILDGWGHRDAIEGNAIAQANLPNFRRLEETYPHTFLQASGKAVGLPDGQMGNSEVGHPLLPNLALTYRSIYVRVHHWCTSSSTFPCYPSSL